MRLRGTRTAQFGTLCPSFRPALAEMTGTDQGPLGQGSLVLCLKVSHCVPFCVFQRGAGAGRRWSETERLGVGGTI